MNFLRLTSLFQVCRSAEYGRGDGINCFVRIISWWAFFRITPQMKKRDYLVKGPGKFLISCCSCVSLRITCEHIKKTYLPVVLLKKTVLMCEWKRFILIMLRLQTHVEHTSKLWISSWLTFLCVEKPGVTRISCPAGPKLTTAWGTEYFRGADGWCTGPGSEETYDT